VNEFKGTPGPWKVVTFQDNDEIHSAEGKCLADSWSYDIGSDCTASLANARLMAAAPDLLELLLEARRTLEMWKDVAPAVSLCADIDAVISKALGEQQ
jgi:hypothetical protein